MADMEKEKMNEESIDDSMFSMYSDWAEDGYADAGESGNGIADTGEDRTENRLQVLEKAQEIDFLESQGETVSESEKNLPEKQAEAWNPFETLVKIVEK